MKDLGKRIRYARTKAKINQDTLGEAAGVTRQAVGAWEKNVSIPDARQLAIVARMLGVTTDWLVGISRFGGPDKEEEEAMLQASFGGPELFAAAFMRKWQKVMDKEMNEFVERLRDDWRRQQERGDS